MTILEVLNFDFSTFEQLSSPKFTKIPSSHSLKLSKITFWRIQTVQKIIYGNFRDAEL